MRIFAQLCFIAAIITGAVAPVYTADANNEAAEPDRVFGVLPNYTTVDNTTAPKLTTRESFKMASLSTFDPVVYPFIGVTTAFGQGASDKSFNTRYATALADNSIGNFMTTAIVPSLTHQDSRYYRRAEGGVFSRVAYAASRSIVTRTREGRAAFNISEIGGNFAAASLSNIYYSSADRTMGGTISRWGTQVMWDTVANEMKEFWPDIHSRLRRK
jgi:hypothetical protein